MNLTPGLIGFQKTHGQRKTPAYKAWAAAKDRCFNAANKDYSSYGGRGITMDPEWRKDFAVFIAAMGPRPDGGTLERVRNEGNYEPGNCVWASHKRQCNNRRTNVFMVFEGRRDTISGWAESVGISRKTITTRLNRDGWSVRESLGL